MEMPPNKRDVRVVCGTYIISEYRTMENFQLRPLPVRMTVTVMQLAGFYMK